MAIHSAASRIEPDREHGSVGLCRYESPSVETRPAACRDVRGAGRQDAIAENGQEQATLRLAGYAALIVQAGGSRLLYKINHHFAVIL